MWLNQSGWAETIENGLGRIDQEIKKSSWQVF